MIVYERTNTITTGELLYYISIQSVCTQTHTTIGFVSDDNAASERCSAMRCGSFECSTQTQRRSVGPFWGDFAAWCRCVDDDDSNDGALDDERSNVVYRRLLYISGDCGALWCGADAPLTCVLVWN